MGSQQQADGTAHATNRYEQMHTIHHGAAVQHHDRPAGQQAEQYNSMLRPDISAATFFSHFRSTVSAVCVCVSFFRQSYVGLRQNASSLLRLALDPEYGRAPEGLLKRLFDQPNGGGNGEGGGMGSGSNPLVQLLSQGGVGSSAPRQMQLDSDSEVDDILDTDEYGQPTGGTNAWGQQSGNGRPLSDRQRRQMLDEARRKKREARHRLLEKRQLVASDPLIHFVYMPQAQAMEAVVARLEAAANRWAELQLQQQQQQQASVPPIAFSPSGSALIAVFLREFPASLLIDCIDFLSFLCLRHSVVFRRFARDRRVVQLLARFFPEPRLTPREIEMEQQMQAQAKTKEEQQPQGNVKLENGAVADVKMESDALPRSTSSSPQPPVGVTAAAATTPVVAVAPGAPTYLPPRPMLPAPILCAGLRFFRICIEVDNSYIRAVCHTHASHVHLTGTPKWSGVRVA
jgi:hypothetical protein